MEEVWHPSERWSEAERRAWQDARLREVAAAAAPHAPALRERLAAAGLDPQALGLDALTRLPVLSKDTLPAAQHASPPFAGWLGVPLARLARAYRSPGPIYDPEGLEPDYWRFAPALFAAGFRAGDVALNTLSYHLTPAGHMFDDALRAIGCPVVPSGPGNTDAQVQILGELGVSGFVGTPSFLVTLLDAARSAGVRHGLRRAFVIAEMLPESLRRRLEADFGITATQGYGTADLGSVAYECGVRAGMHLARETILEVLDPHTGQPVAPGQPGEAVVTALNPVYPLLRFGTGDLVTMAEGACPCGRTAPRIARVVGRIGEAVKVRGLFVHPAEVARIVAQFPEVARAQVVVRRPGEVDEMTVRVELRPGAAAPEAPALREALATGLRLRCDVELLAAGTLGDDAKRIVDERRWD
ncbi:MAG: AMP-binding protein [Armatimonadota bacterium]|nr:AMP-binding protein [Armatimonadota bacterium]